MGKTEALSLHLPKLPELDNEDIKAVRRFLPGKLLSRTAALLSLALLALGFAGAVDQGLKRLLDLDLTLRPWLRFGLLFGLPLVGVASQLLIEWRADRVRRALQHLALQVGAARVGYFRIGSYLDTEEDRTLFHRADRAHEKVLAWIERSPSLPLYLTGDSGTGKSSILNAFVLPELRARGWIVMEARAWQDPQAALLEVFARLPEARRRRQGHDQSLRTLIDAAARRAEKGLLIVLDQFEEFLILGKPERQRAFEALLASMRSVPIPNCKLLLVLRSDYQTFLEEIGLPPLRHGENFYQVARFAYPAAAHFLTR